MIKKKNYIKIINETRTCLVVKENREIIFYKIYFVRYNRIVTLIRLFDNELKLFINVYIMRTD